MNFEEFVTSYWNKNRGKTGKPWDPTSVAEWEGIPVDLPLAMFSYCERHAGLTDAQLIALEPVIKQTPFGIVIQDTGANESTGVMDVPVSQVTVRQLVAAIIASTKS
jgi:hypothetical protein